MHRLRTTITTATALTALLATLAGCKTDDGSSKPKPGSTLVVAGATNEQVTCNETPYDYALSSKEPGGSGIAVSHGIVRGTMYVSCTPPGPDSFDIVVIIVRDGTELKPGSEYKGIPTIAGYEAWTIVKCVPGTYRLYYFYLWTLEGGKQSSSAMTTPRTVTAHDCDS